MGLNVSIFSGRTTSEIELKKTNSDKNVCDFSLAVNEGAGDKQVTVYPRFVAFERWAEILSKYPKGTKMTINGKYAERKYTDRNGDEKKVSEFIVIYADIHGAKVAEKKETVMMTENLAQNQLFGNSEQFKQRV